MHHKAYGFTIVELLVVIVVIAILAAITTIGFSGVSERARDAQRTQDISSIAKALELYYLDNGEFPNGQCGVTGAPVCPSPKKENTRWATTSDGSWNVLEAALVPKYISSLPKDPQASTDLEPAIRGGSNYDYTRWTNTTCLTGTQGYILTYRLESQAQKRNIAGKCPDGTSNPAGWTPSSEYIVIK